jgi:putative ABC transport system permease protein
VSGRAALAPRPQGTGARPGPDASAGGSWLGPVRTASGGMRRHKVATIVIAVVLFVATASATLGLALLAASNGPFTHAFSAQRGADVTVTANAARASNAELAATGHLAGVTALAGPFAEATTEVNFQGQPWGQLQLAGRPASGGPVDDLVLNAGHWVDGPGQVVLNGYEGNGGIADGNTVQVTSAPGQPTLTVVGFANSITSTADGWVAPSQIAALRAPGTPATAQLLYRFTAAGSDAQIRADVAAITRALPAGTVANSASWLTAQSQAEGNGAIMEPFVLAFALIGLVMAVLIVGNVISGAVVAQYQRIGVLKSLGLTPAQVVAVYLNRVTWPAIAGCLVGAAAGGLLSLSVLHKSAGAYGVGSQQLPWSALVIAPAAMFALTVIAALGPAVRAGRLSAIEAIAAGRAPRSGHGYAAHRLAAKLRLPRPVGLGVAAPFARPARTLVTLAAVAFGATAVIFAVGLHSSLSRAAAAQSLSGTVPVQIQQTWNGAGPNQTPTEAQLAKLTAMLRAQPGTAHEVTLYGDQVTVAGVSQQVQVGAFDGPSAWTGYALIAGHWYDAPGEVDANTSFLDASGLAVGDSTTVDTGTAQSTVRIVGEVFDPSRQPHLYGATRSLPGLATGQNFWQVDVGLRPGTSAAAYIQAVNAKFGANGTFSAMPPSGGQFYVIASALIGFLALMVAIAAGLGVLNTVLMTTRDRVHDLGVFKALGMRPGQIVTMVICWIAVPAIVAAAMAAPAAVALNTATLHAMGATAHTGIPASFSQVFGPLRLALLSLAAVAIAVAGALLPATWAARTRPATALRAE